VGVDQVPSVRVGRAEGVYRWNQTTRYARVKNVKEVMIKEKKKERTGICDWPETSGKPAFMTKAPRFATMALMIERP